MPGSALTWELVDLDSPELYVGEQLQRVGRQLLRRETKTEGSEAPLPLPEMWAHLGVVREHSTPLMAGIEGALPELQGTHLHPLSAGGVAGGTALPGVCAPLWFYVGACKWTDARLAAGAAHLY